MSGYRSFERCIICRTRSNLNHYRGSFEETMLINSLYIAVMFPLETRQKNGLAKAKKIAKYLKDHNLVDVHNNIFNADDIIRCLRKALAHYNVKIENESHMISSIKLWSINRPNKPICKTECIWIPPRCLPTQYNANADGEICTFVFSMPELRSFTYYVIDQALSIASKSICSDCEYRTDNL